MPPCQRLSDKPSVISRLESKTLVVSHQRLLGHCRFPQVRGVWDGFEPYPIPILVRYLKDGLESLLAPATGDGVERVDGYDGSAVIPVYREAEGCPMLTADKLHPAVRRWLTQFC